MQLAAGLGMKPLPGVWKARAKHEKRGNILWKTLWKLWISLPG
jgi:hypothetical protein